MSSPQTRVGAISVTPLPVNTPFPKMPRNRAKRTTQQILDIDTYSDVRLPNRREVPKVKGRVGLMSVIKQAKMTQKTLRTIEVASEILGVAAIHLRKDRTAIDEMEGLLKSEGYEWIPAKQEWAKMTPPPPLPHLRHFVIMTQDEDADVIEMLIQAGADALCAKVKLVERIDTFSDDAGIISHLFMEMTE